jgi:hypothetical protein
MERHTGMAPVTARSGYQGWVHWRRHCPKFLRQAVVEGGAQAIPHASWARRCYEQHRARGSAHQAALRVGPQVDSDLVPLLEKPSPYDEATDLTALQRRDSPLLR